MSYAEPVAPDQAFALEVECFERSGECWPARLHFGAGRREAVETLDRWPGNDHTYFKLRGRDGASYIVRHNRTRDSWRLVVFERFERRPGDRHAATSGG